MDKKIAVIVRDRQAEALRMAVGLTLADDQVTVFVMDHNLEESDPAIAGNIEALREMNVRIYTNNPLNRCDYLSTGKIARQLLHFDIVIPY